MNVTSSHTKRSTGRAEMLRDQAGAPLRILVDPNGQIHIRSKLCAQIRTHGGEIALSPQEAHYILVNPQSASGRRYIRTWGNNPSKPVLDYHWLEFSVSEGSLQQDVTPWLATDDGIEEQEDSDDEFPCPIRNVIDSEALPTPRQTPAMSHGSKADSACISPISATFTESPYLPRRLAAATFTPREYASSASASSSRHETSFPIATNPQTTQSAPATSSTSFGQQQQQMQRHDSNFLPNGNTYQQPPHNQNLFPDFLSSIQQNPMAVNPSALVSQMQSLVTLGLMDPVQAQQIIQRAYGMMQSIIPGGGMPGMMMQPGPFNPMSGGMGFNGWMPNGMGGMPGLQGVPPSMSIGAPPMPFPIPNGMTAPAPQRDASPFTQPYAPDHSPPSPPSMTFDPDTRSVKRKAKAKRQQTEEVELDDEDEDDTSFLTRRGESSKGKQKEVHPANTHDPSPPTHVSSSLALVTTPTAPTPTSSHTARPFARNGKKLQFFIEIPIRGKRSKLIEMIKNGGGASTITPEQADYVVLNPPDSSNDLYKMQAEPLGIPVINQKFIKECVAAGELLDHTPYLYEPPPKRKRTTTLKPESSSTSYGRKSRKSVEEETEASGSTVKFKTEPDTEVIDLSSDNEGIEPPPRKFVKREASPSNDLQWDADLRTPTPPPTNAVPAPRGNRFTQEEREYAVKYAGIVWRRDPSIAWTAICERLAKKIPSHPLSSWVAVRYTNTRGGDMREKLDTAKRRAEIDYRKRLAQKEQTAVHYRPRGELPSKKARLTERAKEAPPVNVELDQDVVAALDALEPTERDLDVLVQFFLNGADKLEGDDDGILEILTKKTHCSSRRHWKDFHQEYAGQVKERYEKLKAEMEMNEVQVEEE